MAAVRWNFLTGAPEIVREPLRRSVAGHVRGVRGFKLGRTSDPDARAKHPDYASYDELIVVYQTTSPDHADEVEDQLVDHFHDSDNMVAGGGGPLGPPPYFVYVVVEL